MAQIAQYTCDRCAGGMNSNDLCWLRISYSDAEGKNTTRIDFCALCEKEFKDWFGAAPFRGKDLKA